MQDFAAAPGAQVWAYTRRHPNDNNEAWNLASNGSIVEVMSGLWYVSSATLPHSDPSPTGLSVSHPVSIASLASVSPMASPPHCTAHQVRVLSPPPPSLDAPTTAPNGPVVINTCSSSATQKWIWDSTTLLITNGADSNLCLDFGESTWVNPCSLPPASGMAMCDTTLTFQQRVTDLVSNLTTAEKMGLFANGAKAVSRLNIGGYQWWSEALHGEGLPCECHFLARPPAHLAVCSCSVVRL